MFSDPDHAIIEVPLKSHETISLSTRIPKVKKSNQGSDEVKVESTSKIVSFD